jgi:uncharacterized protein (TIGR04255 family)
MSGKPAAGLGTQQQPDGHSLPMTITFKKAPLAEIVAEVRWASEANPSTNRESKPSASVIDLSALLFAKGSDELFMSLGGKIHSAGFTRAERVLPPGFPPVAGQVVWRYRKGENSPELLQVGNGVFSANCVPPYSSWDEFSATVELGITAIVAARAELGDKSPFTQVSLRYIDAFSEDLIGGKSYPSFIAEVLGFNVGMPDVIGEIAHPTDAPQVALQLTVPLREKMLMSVSVGAGIVQNVPALLMDTTVSSTQPIDLDVKSVMQALNAAHGIIRKTFLSLTEKIHDRMQPSEKGI